MAWRSAAWLLMLAVLGAGCGKTEKLGPSGTTTTGGSGSTGGSSSEGGADTTATPLMCADPHPGPSPLTRLSAAELNRSLLAQVPRTGNNQGLLWLPEGMLDERLGSVSPLFVDGLHTLAHDIAQILSDPSSDETRLRTCDVPSQGEASCRDQLVTQIVEQAYRRPITDEDRTEMNEVFATGKMLGGDFASGLRAVVEVALQNPDFVYLIEQGDGVVKGDAVELTSFETAARLAYFLTGAPPDDKLFAAAKKGPLGPTELEAQARRLVGTAPNRALVTSYYKQLFRFGSKETVAELGYTEEIAKLADEETSHFIENVSFDGAGTLRALVTEPSTWVNQPLAAFYGYTGVTGQAFQKVQLDPTQRGGLFTQTSFLRSYGRETRPVQRSIVILRKLLCHELPPPPPAVPPAPIETPQFHTTRERLAFSTQDAVCQDCHKDINPVGFAFEHYDAFGKWRDTENGDPIDSAGELYVTDAEGPFKSAIDLLQRIAESGDAKKCAVGQWLGEAYRRDETPEDECAKAELVKAFQESDGKLVELLVALPQTDNFRYRLGSELAP